MSFQQVRGAIAKLTSDALATGGVPFADQHWDNVGETPGKDAAGTYAVINISFPRSSPKRSAVMALSTSLAVATSCSTRPSGRE
jgi:hypothetical protein